MNIVSIWLWLFHYGCFQQAGGIFQINTMFTKGQPGGAIFCSVLAANIDYYGSLPKTLNLTPPELMRNTG
jgi:hypothetical protein